MLDAGPSTLTVEHVMRLAPDPDLGFALAGLLMLVVAEAFRIGIALREDAEEII